MGSDKHTPHQFDGCGRKGYVLAKLAARSGPGCPAKLLQKFGSMAMPGRLK
jgi:hypothetical protein